MGRSEMALQHSEAVGLSNVLCPLGQGKKDVLQKWLDDLLHLVTMGMNTPEFSSGLTADTGSEHPGS